MKVIVQPPRYRVTTLQDFDEILMHHITRLKLFVYARYTATVVRLRNSNLMINTEGIPFTV